VDDKGKSLKGHFEKKKGRMEMTPRRSVQRGKRLSLVLEGVTTRPTRRSPIGEAIVKRQYDESKEVYRKGNAQGGKKPAPVPP